MSGPYRSPGERHAPSCPRCDGRTLSGRHLESGDVDECDGCGGLFVARAVLAALLADRNLAGELRLDREPLSRAGRFYLKCPVCETLMNRRQLAPALEIVVDECAPHGSWFDPRELVAIAQHVQNGGKIVRSPIPPIERPTRTRKRAGDDDEPPPSSRESAVELARTLARLMAKKKD